jgi:hypothetical protein
MSSMKPEERKPNGTTLTVEEWIDEMNKYDRLHQYAKRRRECSKGGDSL